MKFKVLNAHKKNQILLVTGCYSPEEGEKELLEELRKVLMEVNKTVDNAVLCDRVVSNDKTILFKSIPIDTLYTVLQLHNNSFDLHLRVVMGKNMQGNRFKEDIKRYFLSHTF